MHRIQRRHFCKTAAGALLAAAGCTPRAPIYRGLDLAGAPYRSGYTQCPDVCPTALTRALEIRRRLGKPRDLVQVVFITVDPERDTPDIVREYVRAFDPAYEGLSGTPAQTAQAAANYRVVYRKVPNGASYSMDHTALTFVVDPRGRVRLAFPHAQPAQECADDLEKLFRYDGAT